MKAVDSSNSSAASTPQEKAEWTNAAHLQTLFDESPLGIYLIDADFRIRAVNPIALPVFGDIANLIGSDFDETIHRIWEKEFADEVTRIFRRTLETGEPYQTSTRVEKRRDRHLEENYEWQISRIMLPEGQYGVVCYFRDISAAVQSEKTIEESEAELSKLNRRIEQQAVIYNTTLSTITDYVYRLDRHGKFIYANQALLDLWGITELPEGGISMPELDYPPEVEAKVLEGVQRVFETKRTVKDQTAYTSPTGAIEFHEFIFNPVLTDEGEVDFIIGSSRDISEHKKLEIELKSADRLKDEFLATLSHELRTPLNAILGWSQMLRTPTLSASEREKAILTIERNAKSQSQLIDDILDVSRIITGKLRLDVRAVDLTNVIAAAVDAARPAAEAKGIRLQMLLDPQAGPISGDPDRLQQVVWNLLSNAVKFTPKRGRVQIRLERVNSHVEITVSDTGKGIEAKFLPHVFDRFRQSDGSMTRRHGGLGLGLAIVRQIVELHGGIVSVNSAGEGQGTTFIVNLPLLPLRQEPPSDVPRVHPQAANNAPVYCPPELEDLRVLLVDDEADSRDLLNFVLESCGASVSVANSAVEALNKIDSEKFDVIVSDIGMPNEDGFSLIGKIRALPNERGGNTPAIALTAYARSEDRIQALRAGFQMHIAKPVEPVELVTAVANLAGRIEK